jgi:predicted ester cyclase
MTKTELIQKFFEIVDNHQIDRLPEIEAADLVMRTPMAVLHGPAGHAQMIKGFAGAFPNMKHQSARILESGDWVVAEGSFVGDHTGPMYMPTGDVIPATHKHVDFPYAMVARVVSGKLAELNVYFDNMAFLSQLGLVPGAKAA